MKHEYIHNEERAAAGLQTQRGALGERRRAGRREGAGRGVMESAMAAGAGRRPKMLAISAQADRTPAQVKDEPRVRARNTQAICCCAVCLF